MKKPWSITTTLRNPERLRDFLIVLKEMEGQEWDLAAQKNYQILLIKHRVYGYGSTQFYQGFSKKQVDLIDDLAKNISFEQAKAIFNSKGYEDPSMRGRQSINPLRKLGLVAIKGGKVCLTDLGRFLLKEDYDLGEMFLRSFIKWQIPNPDNDDYKYEDGYDIKPFIGTLHLIATVNKKSVALGEEPKGISKQEFSLFAPALVNYSKIDEYAGEILKLRNKLSRKEKHEQKEIMEDYRQKFARKFLGSENRDDVESLLNNLKDYGDNAIRYFRLTRYLYIRGGGFYVDLEPRRKVEIKNLLRFDGGKSLHFKSREKYLAYIADIAEPKLPWETKENYIEIVQELFKEIRSYEKKLEVKERPEAAYKRFTESDLKKYTEKLRQYRRELQEKDNHFSSQGVEAVERYIGTLKNIFKEEDKPIALEKYVALSLHALNDALKIQPNYPVGDDNEPTFTAPAGKPDIECFYESFNAICEVTMLTGRDQWYNEGQPVMRHLRDFEEKNSNKSAYCVFVAPALHRDTLNTFWTSVRYEYEGKPQKIIPLSLGNFVELLKTLTVMKQKGKFLAHSELVRLYEDILSCAFKAKNVNEWIPKVPEIISGWQKRLTA